MKILKLFLILVASTALNFFCLAQEAQRNIPDVSKIHGFNYESAPTIGHNEMWLQYSSAETARDMDYAKRLNLNQVRVFLGYSAYLTNKPAFRSNLIDFIHVCHERGISVMATRQYPSAWAANQDLWPLAKEYAADLVNTIGNGKESNLAFWDVHNEPGFPSFQFARHMAGVDKITPITIGSTIEGEMEATGGDLVDVLCFHDYSTTRHQIHEHIERAKQYAASQGKPKSAASPAPIPTTCARRIREIGHGLVYLGTHDHETMRNGAWSFLCRRNDA